VNLADKKQLPVADFGLGESYAGLMPISDKRKAPELGLLHKGA